MSTKAAFSHLIAVFQAPAGRLEHRFGQTKAPCFRDQCLPGGVIDQTPVGFAPRLLAYFQVARHEHLGEPFCRCGAAHALGFLAHHLAKDIQRSKSAWIDCDHNRAIAAAMLAQSLLGHSG